MEECNATWLSAWEIGVAECGDEALYPTRGPIGTGCGNILRTSHILMAFSCMCCATTHPAKSWMCTCTPGAVATSAGNLDGKRHHALVGAPTAPLDRPGGGLVLWQPWPCGVLRLHQPAVLDVGKTQQKGRGLDRHEATARGGASGTWCDRCPMLRIGGL